MSEVVGGKTQVLPVVLMQGVKMLWKFKQLLNPAQVFDLMTGGPKIG